MVYSPKIAEDLVPRIYKLAKARDIPMTRLVDEMLRKELDRADAGKHLKRDPLRTKEFKRWLKALAIAKVLFQE